MEYVPTPANFLCYCALDISQCAVIKTRSLKYFVDNEFGSLLIPDYLVEAKLCSTVQNLDKLGIDENVQDFFDFVLKQNDFVSYFEFCDFDLDCAILWFEAIKSLLLEILKSDSHLSLQPTEYCRRQSRNDFVVKNFLEKAMEREKIFDVKENCANECKDHTGIEETQCADDLEEKNACEDIENISEIQEIKDIGVEKEQEISEERKFDCGEKIAILDEWNIEEFHFAYVLCAIEDGDFGDFGEVLLKVKLLNSIDGVSNDYWKKNFVILDNFFDIMRYERWKWKKKKCRLYLV